jgi:LacI family transcriptional regulator
MVLRRYDRQVLHHVVGLLLPKAFHRSPYYDPIFHGVMDVLAPTEYDAVLITPPENGEEEAIFRSPTFRRAEVDGIIVFAYHSTEILVHWLRENPAFGERPVVTLIYPTPGCACVGVDYAAGSYAATRHLLALGHQHLLHFGVDGALLPARLAGMERALRDAGLEPSRYLHLATGADWYVGQDTPGPADVHMHGTTQAGAPFTGSLCALLREYPEITGLLAWNDPCAQHLQRALRAEGYRVPDDYSLVGFDDTDPLLDAPGGVPLTSLRVPLCEIGREAMRRLIAGMAGEALDTSGCDLVPELIVRASTAPPRRTAAPDNPLVRNGLHG